MVQADENEGSEATPSYVDRGVVVESRKVGDRKYIAFWVAFASSVLLLLFGEIDGDQYVDIQVVVFGLYMAGNVGEYAMRGRHRRGYGQGGAHDW